jgi:hypothetical protein
VGANTVGESQPPTWLCAGHAALSSATGRVLVNGYGSTASTANQRAKHHLICDVIDEQIVMLSSGTRLISKVNLILAAAVIFLSPVLFGLLTRARCLSLLRALHRSAVAEWSAA